MSRYPDGTTRNSEQTLAVVASPQAALFPKATARPAANHIANRHISRIVSHRVRQHQDGSLVEDYLVEWKTAATDTASPLSWHPLEELRGCLKKLQKYIYNLPPSSTNDAEPLSKNNSALNRGVRRKRPDFIVEEETYGLAPPLERLFLDKRVSDPEQQAYRGRLKVDNGHIKVDWSRITEPGVQTEHVPWDAIKQHAAQVGTALPQGRARVKVEFERRLHDLNRARPHSRLSISNNVDDTVPSLNFKFVGQHRLGQGVTALDPETIVGCGAKYDWGNQRCNPHMGQNIGCEYSRLCDCMEYAAIDKGRLTLPERQWMRDNPGETKMNLPKRFAYYTSGSKQGCLVPFYLKDRCPIYECNAKCACGDGCRNRLVQFGCRVPLEIFKTSNGRGWGLRCAKDLKPGEFIDTYRGEVITGEEADRRERHSKSASYLFTLDKFAGDDSDMQADDCYVVDGEYVGGPTRFINHSCDPNCQQHTVSLNKFDRKVYLLAFFANQFIPKGTELTFDYMDKDGEVEDLDAEDKSKLKPCLCGSDNCRGVLWL